MTYNTNNNSIPSQRRSFRRLRIYIYLLIVIIPLLIILWVYLFSHDWNLWRLDRSFNTLTHPVNTTLISHHKEIGLLIGNSNHCDFFVGDLRSYSNSKQNIQRFYQGKTIWNPIRRSKQQLKIAFIDKNGVSGYKYPNIEVPYPVSDIARALKQKNDNNSYYLVYILDTGYDVGLDIRCI